MQDTYLFAEEPTIYDVIEHQRQSAEQTLSDLPATSVLHRPIDELLAELVGRFRLDVPVLDRANTTQLPNEEVDIDVSGDIRRAFLDDGPHYVKGTAVRIAVPFKGEAILFGYATSPYSNGIPGDVDNGAVVLAHMAEHADPTLIRGEFENLIDQIEHMLQMLRGPAEEWNQELPKLVRSRLEERRSKLRHDKELALGYATALPTQAPVTIEGSQPLPARLDREYDVFLSHASEDKSAIARPLYSALVAQGISVWFDEAVLEMGDSLRRKIDDGLATCRYGVVILSPRFLAKQWPQRELDGLVARETASGGKAILPIWHDLDGDTLLRYSPVLADRFAGRSEEGVASLVEKILRVLRN